MKFSFSILFVLTVFFSCLGQEEKQIILKSKDSITNSINPLSPAKAAFYSAILPGLGQVYNKKYWKVPLVYIGLGTTMYFVLDNDKKYNSFRDAYKSRLEGNINDEYYNIYSDATLERGIKITKRNRDLSILFTVLVYALNIIDANVDAHLMQFNVNDDLTIAPEFTPSLLNASSIDCGLKLSLKIN